MSALSTSPVPKGRSGSMSGDANGYLLLTIPHARVNQVCLQLMTSSQFLSEWWMNGIHG
jgi:hypothetical protein